MLDPSQDLPKGSGPIKIHFAFKYVLIWGGGGGGEEGGRGGGKGGGREGGGREGGGGGGRGEGGREGNLTSNGRYFNQSFECGISRFFL